MIGRLLNRILGSFKMKLVRNSDETPDIHKDSDFIDIYTFCAPFTMTSIERMYALYQSVNYILDKDIPGDFVECGVWKGGSAMLIARVLQSKGIKDRKIYLYDTYEGMTRPGERDITFSGKKALSTFKQKSTGSDTSDWCLASVEEVRGNMKSTGMGERNYILVKGKVEETIPANLPSNPIALLRLDTDWYESTKHELIHLYPLMTSGAVLIVDDYGHWEGARQAVQEYFSASTDKILLNRIDYSCRVGIKI